MIELYLSSDGKHTVHASADTPEQLAALTPKVKALYEEILTRFGTKAQMWQQPNGQSKPDAQGRTGGAREPEEDNRPICPNHGRRMIFRQGQYGGFWSCPARTSDGHWCRYTMDEPAKGPSPTAKA